jgi:transcription elongation factor Elf1
MENKICSKCKTEKSFDSFLWKNKSKNLKHSVCSECYKEIRKKSYDTNAQYYKDKSRRRRKDHANQYEEYKKYLSCLVCGESESSCLDFHHLDGSRKDFSVATRKYSTGNFEVTKNEIEKCVVLCANCHRKLHAGVITLS